jgi:hypothetical protein
MGGPYQFKAEDAEAFAKQSGIRYRISRSEILFETCPFCKSRKDKYTFAISLKTGQYNCKRASCGAKGNMIDLSQAFNFELDRISSEYYAPKRHYKIFNKPKEAIEPAEPAVAYLSSRGIPAEIVKQYQVTSKADKKTGIRSSSSPSSIRKDSRKQSSIGIQRLRRTKNGSKRTASQLARIGAINDAIALTNCPNVRVLASLSPFTTQPIRGLRDTCIKVLPMPRKQKDTSIIG